MPRHSTLGRRLILAATTVALSAGLATGVASAETTGTVSSSTTSSSSWINTKWAASDIAGCKFNTKLPWCRNR